MPLQGISTGKDIVLNFQDSNGQAEFCRVKSFTSSQMTTNIESQALDGINRPFNIPKGWKGSFDMERTSSATEDYIAYLEGLYYSGQNQPYITITETITEQNSFITQYQYVNCVLVFDDTGTRTADNYITQKVSFTASQRNKLS